MFETVLSLIRGATQVTPIVTDLVQAILPAFNGTQQDQLKSALAEARQRSDAAQNDFVQASRGK